MHAGMLWLALLSAASWDSNDTWIVRFGNTAKGNSPRLYTREMLEDAQRIHHIDRGMDKKVVSAAVDQLFGDFAKHDPTLFVPMVVGSLMRVAPKDPRTVEVLRRSLKEGWIEPIRVHTLWVLAGAPPRKHIDYLIMQLNSSNVRKRIDAIDSLSSCGAKAKRALPRLERIVRESDSPPDDFRRAYTTTYSAPEHVHAQWAIDRIKECLGGE